MQILAVMPLLLVSVGLMDTLQGSLCPRGSRNVGLGELATRGTQPPSLQVQSHLITRRDLFSQETPLDMAPASFDDQYTGCAAAMTAALADLNHTEFQTNKVYADGWTLASNQWQERRVWGPVWGLSPTRLPPPPPGFRDEHVVALLAYTANSPLHKEFNAAVREAGRSRAHYLHHFSFKTLHFLLTEALQLLGRSQHSPRCHQVYRGVHGLRFRPAGPGAMTRSASLGPVIWIPQWPVKAPFSQTGPCCCCSSSLWWGPFQRVQASSDPSDIEQPCQTLCRPEDVGHVCALRVAKISGKPICRALGPSLKAARPLRPGDTIKNLGTESSTRVLGMIL
ncbi:GPI-linked NAD(P)(+)--arginine ADP-ribosyltransferase 1 isoform X2 [Sciurus carolinensis]|uniref:GPI-linked NAD(P)(+)--arginine ADP-ribosyltransferase 1 isoform X2 n=1 Tax=Sciurus carolinensis TaxID=30640 RepID=UPI001FB51CA3|nr:GPI-linked NAD(P)(+)--arginine ADP-ribosyltransferase 1 isoform X2 [Sciurus carolinensis]